MKKVTITLEQFGQIEVNPMILDPNYRENYFRDEPIVKKPIIEYVEVRKAPVSGGKNMPSYIVKEGEFYLNTKTDRYLTKAEIRELIP